MRCYPGAVPNVARAALAGAALLVPGCASVPACPRKGGPPWSEWITTHFRTWTDLGEGEAEEVADQFEQMRASLMGFARRGLLAPSQPRWPSSSESGPRPARPYP
jgi:hypothetical protein